ncbi:hypothetical protein BDV93DRAFT_101802 [Ceratobasidium sp. AG-I]|nr:hypothetical protein BDV93DRAFT_101802 [Ceratobasidium sp. AG-I]
MQKVFDNGEILSLILGHLSRPICVRLVTTSQNFFKQGAPHVWRRLHTPQPLLFLLPGTKKVTKQHNNVYIELPSPSVDFSRFDFYARFVQTLEIFGPSNERGHSNEFQIDASWQTLLFRAQQLTLLPNLRELKLNKTFGSDDDPALWLTAFLSPSVKTFGFESVKLYTNAASSMASVALRLATQTCSDLERITLYLGPTERANSLNNNTPAQASVLHILMGAPISRTWSNVRNLRSLVTDVYALDADSLLALGQLPHLGSLEIRKLPETHHTRSTSERLPISIRSMALSDNSFPSLRRLAFYKEFNPG